jgi:hypothetical protein
LIGEWGCVLRHGNAGDKAQHEENKRLQWSAMIGHRCLSLIDMYKTIWRNVS